MDILSAGAKSIQMLVSSRWRWHNRRRRIAAQKPITKYMITSILERRTFSFQIGIVSHNVYVVIRRAL